MHLARNEDVPLALASCKVHSLRIHTTQYNQDTTRHCKTMHDNTINTRQYTANAKPQHTRQYKANAKLQNLLRGSLEWPFDLRAKAGTLRRCLETHRQSYPLQPRRLLCLQALQPFKSYNL